MIIFLHGFMGTPRDWEDILSKLTTKEEYICPILPGHIHLSPPPINNGFDASIERLRELYPSTKTSDSITLVGYSLGGRLALEYWYKYPQHISKLVLISTNFGINDPQKKSSREIWDALKAELIRKKGLKSFMENDWYSMPIFESFRKNKHYERIISHRLCHSKEYIAQAIQAFSPSKQRHFFSNLSHLPETHYIYGEDDTKYALQSKKLTGYTNISTHKISYSGHVVHLENPLKVSMLLNKIL